MCLTLSVFENIMRLPTYTVTVFGLKHPLSVSSQPGPEPEPDTGVIVTE